MLSATAFTAASFFLGLFSYGMISDNFSFSSFIPQTPPRSRDRSSPSDRYPLIPHLAMQSPAVRSHIPESQHHTILCLASSDPRKQTPLSYCHTAGTFSSVLPSGRKR